MEYKSYVPEETNLKEFTFKALFLGVLMAIVLGMANAYLGLKVGMTVAATFPAAVVAMAVLRIFKGNILEENIARTTASVGEALVAGAIFTIPAFVISGVWDEIQVMDSAIIILAGATGNLGGRIARAITKRGANVRAIVRPSSDPDKVEELRKRGVTIAKVDFNSVTEVTKACLGVLCVISALSGLRGVIVEVQTLVLDAAVKAG